MSSCIAAHAEVVTTPGMERAACLHRFLECALDVDLFLDPDQDRLERGLFLDRASPSFTRRFVPRHLNRIRRFAADLPRHEQRRSDHDDRNNRAAEQSTGIAVFHFVCDRAVQRIRNDRERERPRERREERLRQEVTKIKRECGEND
ncbi:MAG: hypothetical protein ACREXU_15465 [Gammaproteobacteria bacterium]